MTDAELRRDRALAEALDAAQPRLPPRLLAQLSWLFEVEADAVEIAESDHVEADRLRRVSSELSTRAVDAGESASGPLAFVGAS